MTEAKFITEDGKLFWQETTKTEVSAIGCIYLCRHKDHALKGDQHLVYKLCKESIRSNLFTWSALWNSCGTFGPGYNTIDEAIIDAISRGNIVIQTIFEKLIISDFKFE